MEQLYKKHFAEKRNCELIEQGVKKTEEMIDILSEPDVGKMTKP
jgi:hypothetical protein